MCVKGLQYGEYLGVDLLVLSLVSPSLYPPPLSPLVVARFLLMPAMVAGLIPLAVSLAAFFLGYRGSTVPPMVLLDLQ